MTSAKPPGERLRVLLDVVLGAPAVPLEQGSAEIVIPDDVRRAAEMRRRVLVLQPLD